MLAQLVLDRVTEVLERQRPLYLMQTLGPALYVVRGESLDKKFKVCIGSRQMCSCADGELCVHLLFVMLRVLAVPQANAVRVSLSVSLGRQSRDARHGSH